MDEKKLREKLVKFIRRKIGDQQDVEDVVQDTMISILDSQFNFKGDSSLETWVLGIAKHEISDFYRRKKIKQIVFSRLPFLKELVSEALGPELAYQELETKKRILQTLKNLSEGYSKILRLKYIDELSMKEIGKKLDLTVKAVESRLTRARLAFQKIYVQETGKNWSFTDD
ncbi:MAG: RNA polymerase sigma factor [Candidatus Beckwithbacteria bacterium]|nr:RNA polymerase sigma factor [Candidatus Beckwithbacteria bacterium]